jgi:hypothetical protein
MVFHVKDTKKDKAPSGDLVEVCLESFTDPWIEHPNPEVDIAILPFQPIEDASKTNRTPIFRSGIDESFFLNSEGSRDLSPIEDLLMIGYPGGHWDCVNNLPVYRRGVTASHPGFDFQGRSEFLIDLACFPGSSGSPVFLFNPNGFRRGEDLVIGERFAFMGLLYAGPTHPIQGRLSVDSDDQSIEIPITANSMMHLGYVIKAREVSAAIDCFENALRIRGDGNWDFGAITVTPYKLQTQHD